MRTNIEKYISLYVTESGEFNDLLAAEVSARNYIISASEAGCHVPTLEFACEMYSRQGWKQPPKLVEAIHPSLELSKDYKMPFNLDAYQVERICSNIHGNEFYMGELYSALETLNPEIKSLKAEPKDYGSVIMGMVSAFNLDDIYDWIHIGHGMCRTESQRTRQRELEPKLKVCIEWVLSEKTLRYLEDYTK